MKINLELEELRNLYWSGTKPAAGSWTTDMSKVVPGALGTTNLYVDYVYLDTDERRRFAQVSHEYLCHQLQFTGDESASAGTTNLKIKTSFNHPVTELVWVVQPESNVEDNMKFGKQWFNFTDAVETVVPTLDAATVGAFGAGAGGASSVLLPTISVGENPVAFAKLQLNGHDRFSERDGRYFNLKKSYTRVEKQSECKKYGDNCIQNKLVVSENITPQLLVVC